MRKSRLHFIAVVFLILIVAGCSAPNNPYRASEEAGDANKDTNVFYTSFAEPPKHLDPAKSYSSDEYDILAQIYEPPLQYHYLKRPYTLIPLTAEEVPRPAYYDRSGKRLNADAPPELVHRAVYEIRIKKGLLYEDHPAFAKDAKGSLLYANLSGKDASSLRGIRDFPARGTREVRSDDYIFQIKRLADPRIESPILPILEKYILGLGEYSKALRAAIENGKKGNGKKTATLDYGDYPLQGVERVDDYTFRIILKTKYPQFIYWLAMPFFAPVPKEAHEFYAQAALIDKNITLNRFPIGTGPYAMAEFNPNMEMVLEKNPNFRVETYPDSGEAGDMEAGLLKDAGKRLPFIDKLVFKLEKEAIPRWNKFLQGYYDNSGITSDSFDQAVAMSDSGGVELTGEMKDKGIRLLTSVRPSSYYAGFNMTDNVVGGYGAAPAALRQAISIALDYEEYIEIFNNGRGLPAHSIIAPGIFGYVDGVQSFNPYVYEWDKAWKRPKRKSMEYARKLMGQAGFPEGRTKDGSALTITFDNPWTGVDSASVIAWHIKKLKALGIQLENRTTDYNRFQEKMLKGDFQFFSWGWNADYPDPENFFFLLSSATSKVKYQGENVANYSSAEFDAMFRKMENMDSTPERLEVIRRMTDLTQRDAPLVWGYHPVVFALFHGWIANVKPNAMVNNAMKYYRIDKEARVKARSEWNAPEWLPAIASVVLLIALASGFALWAARRKRGPRGG
ncbi:MAG: ABC transporter substrate-binding protein, partial [Deltaproteobacteria bacterium]